jgi:ketosteroid isomerase-like protein
MMINTDRAVIEDYLAGMQAGPGGLDGLVALFTEDAVYVEPFAGQPVVHSGKEEIRAFFANALQQHLNGARLTLDRLDLDGERLRSEWTCHIPMFTAPMHGFDLVTLRGGRIARLETIVTDMPPIPNA